MALNVEERLNTEHPSEDSGGKNASYGRILTSNYLIGGSQAIGLLLGLIRVKLGAILIGAEGIGLHAMLQGLLSVGSTICGLGLQQSGAREIARAFATDNRIELSRAVKLIRRIAWLSGGLGLASAVCFAAQISELNFGTSDQKWQIVLIGVAVLIGNITISENVAILGTRQISKVARIGIWSGLLGTATTVACYLWLGVNGVAPALVVSAIVNWLLNRFGSRSIPLEPVSTTWAETKSQTAQLLKLGVAVAISGILSTLTIHLIRLMVLEHQGLIGVGLYSAAFAISGMFVGILLSAMGTDLLPALSASSNNFRRMNELLNQQTEIILLLAFPGLMCTLLFAPFLLTLFYSNEFAAAEPMLTWLIIGCFARVLSWPLGYAILAQSKGTQYLLIETSLNAIHLGAVWTGLSFSGLTSVAIAFAIVNLLYAAVMLLTARHTNGFSWSPSIKFHLAWMCLTGAISFQVASILPNPSSIIFGCTAIGLTSLICLHQIANLVDKNHRLNRILRRFSLPKSP
jgi:antigen flippase